jgi:transcriptional regulator with XRE-family HTH domain
MPDMVGVSPVVGPWMPRNVGRVEQDAARKQRLAYAIRVAREQRGLTPPQLAERLERSRGTINDWESGKSAPSLLDLGPLCVALGVDPRLFADLPTEPPSPVLEYLIQDAVRKGVEEGLRQQEAGRPAKRPASRPQE